MGTDSDGIGAQPKLLESIGNRDKDFELFLAMWFKEIIDIRTVRT